MEMNQALINDSYVMTKNQFASVKKENKTLAKQLQNQTIFHLCDHHKINFLAYKVAGGPKASESLTKISRHHTSGLLEMRLRHL